MNEKKKKIRISKTQARKKYANRKDLSESPISKELKLKINRLLRFIVDASFFRGLGGDGKRVQTGLKLVGEDFVDHTVPFD